MTLRFKVLILVSLTQAFAVLGLYWVAETLLLDGHKQLEEERLATTHRELNDGFQSMLNALSMYCWDWATWDDSYDFALELDSSHIDANFTQTAFALQSL